MQTRVGGFEEQALALRSATTTTTTTVVVTRPGGPTEPRGDERGVGGENSAEKRAIFSAACAGSFHALAYKKQSAVPWAVWLLASRGDFWLTVAAIPLEKKGGPIFGPTNPHEPFSEFKNIDFERSHGHFGPINKHLEVLVLDTGFRHLLLALNGRNFGINAHLAVNPTPHRRLKGAGRRLREFCAKNEHPGRPALARPSEVRSLILKSEAGSQKPEVGIQNPEAKNSEAWTGAAGRPHCTQAP
jgi:hypothetical protein